MEKEYVVAISGFIGVITGGVIATISKYIELKHQTKKEKINLILTKIEDIHTKMPSFLSEINELSDDLLFISKENPTDILIFRNQIKELTLRFFSISSSLYLYCPEFNLLTNNAAKTFQQYTDACIDLLSGKPEGIKFVNNYRIELISIFDLILSSSLKKHNSYFKSSRFTTQPPNSEENTNEERSD